MEIALITIAFIVAFAACLAITIAIPAWVIMLVLGALHASGLDGVPAASFFQSCLVVFLIMTVSWLLRFAASDCD